jgi:hypothetical protein
VAGKEKKGRRADGAVAAPAKAAGKAARAAAAAAAATVGEGGEERVAFEGDSSDGGDEEVFEVGGAPAGRRAMRGAGARGAAARGSGSEEGDEDEEAEEGGKDAVVVDEGVSDLDYLRARMKANFDKEEEEEGSAEEEEGSEEEQEGSEGEGVEEEEEEEEEEQEEGSGDQDMAEPGSGSGGKEEEEEEGGEGEGEGKEGEERAGALDAAARGDQTGVGPSGGGGAEEGGGGGGGAEERQILETGRLFVRNLAYDTAEADLSEAFGAHGALEEVHLVLDRWAPCGGGGRRRLVAAAGCLPPAVGAGARPPTPRACNRQSMPGSCRHLTPPCLTPICSNSLLAPRETKKSKGIAYVKFTLPEDAVAAFKALDMTPLQVPPGGRGLGGWGVGGGRSAK